MQQFEKVVSSNIDGYLYLPDQQQLLIQFKTGKVYAYDNVPASVVTAFKAAGSKGSYFNAEIKNAYEGRELDDSELGACLESAVAQSIVLDDCFKATVRARMRKESSIFFSI